MKERAVATTASSSGVEDFDFFFPTNFKQKQNIHYFCLLYSLKQRINVNFIWNTHQQVQQSAAMPIFRLDYYLHAKPRITIPSTPRAPWSYTVWAIDSNVSLAGVSHKPVIIFDLEIRASIRRYRNANTVMCIYVHIHTVALIKAASSGCQV